MNAEDQGSSAAAPLVAVVLPVFNGAKTIAETIASVLGQTFSDFELLVINDGSTDATSGIVAGYRDARVKLHTFENRGVAASRNHGVRLARGRYVAFIDADDLWTPDKLQKQVAALEAEPSASLVYSLTDLIDMHGRRIGRGSYRREAGEVYERLLEGNFLDNGSTPLVRREVFDKSGLFDETNQGAEDWDLWLRIAHQHRFACVPEPQVLYRVHDSGVSMHLARQEAVCLRVLRDGLARLPPSPRRPWLERVALGNLYRYLANRVLVTATGPRTVRPAYRFLWLFVLRGGRRWREIVWAGISLARAMVLTILPNFMARRLVAMAKATMRALGWGS